MYAYLKLIKVMWVHIVFSNLKHKWVSKRTTTEHEKQYQNSLFRVVLANV